MQGVGYLSSTHYHGGTILSLSQLLADAGHDVHTSSHSPCCLLAHNLARLSGHTETDSPLGVAGQGPCDASVY